jgi:hypothetical protein
LFQNGSEEVGWFRLSGPVDCTPVRFPLGAVFPLVEFSRWPYNGIFPMGGV